MAVDIHQIVILFIFFFGVALCMWRAPRADRWHVLLCVIAATLWSGLLVFEPRTRTLGCGVVVATFLIIGLSKPIQARFLTRR